MRRILVLVCTLAIAACGSTEPEGAPIAFPGAVATIADGREIAVVGFLFGDGDSVRVCEALAESYPPQCGGSAALIEGISVTDVDGATAEGAIWWTDFAVELLGMSDGGRLRYVRHVRLPG